MIQQALFRYKRARLSRTLKGFSLDASIILYVGSMNYGGWKRTASKSSPSPFSHWSQEAPPFSDCPAFESHKTVLQPMGEKFSNTSKNIFTSVCCYVASLCKSMEQKHSIIMEGWKLLPIMHQWECTKSNK